MKNRLELINKSFSSTNNEISESNFLLNFNWVPYWFNRNYPEFLENLLTMFIPVLIFLVSLKNRKKNYKMNHNFLIFAIFILIGLAFWFTFSPVYRFSVPYFLSLIFIATLSIFIKKDFSKKVFIIFISLAITFSLSKNIIRISKKDNIYFGIERIKNNYKLLSNNDLANFNVYKSDIKKNNENGWQGRLCWDIPFLCTYNEISVWKKNGYLFVNKLNKTK